MSSMDRRNFPVGLLALQKVVIESGVRRAYKSEQCPDFSLDKIMLFNSCW